MAVETARVRAYVRACVLLTVIMGGAFSSTLTLLIDRNATKPARTPNAAIPC